MGAREDKKKDIEIQDQEQHPTQVVEVPINLELINKKLNYLISLMETKKE